MPPLISIVTSNFNQGKYLKNLLGCLRQQKREQHEYIVVDALSSDDSLETIMASSPVIDALEIAADKGPADGWRRGLELAKGQYVIFINADDALLPSALLRMEKAIIENPDVDIFVAHGLIIDERNGVSRPMFSHQPRFSRLARGIGVVCQQSTVIRRKILLSAQINIFNRTCWDTELLVDCLAKRAVARRIDDIWGLFRLTDSSISGRVVTRESRSRYIQDRSNIAIKHGFCPLSAFSQIALARVEKLVDPAFYRLLAHGNRFRSIRSLESVWPV